MKSRKFNVGDRVTIVKAQSKESLEQYGNHYLDLGGEYTIKVLGTTNEKGYYIDAGRGKSAGWVFEDEIDFIKSKTEELHPVDRAFVINAWDAADSKQKEVIAKYGLSVLDKTVNVPKELIIEGHKIACGEWKKKIEDKFPHLFAEQIEDVIKRVIGEIGDVVYDKYRVVVSGNKVYVPLPVDNSKWLFAAVDWAKLFESRIKDKLSDKYVSIDIPTFGKNKRAFSSTHICLNYFTIKIQ